MEAQSIWQLPEVFQYRPPNTINLFSTGNKLVPKVPGIAPHRALSRLHKEHADMVTVEVTYSGLRARQARLPHIFVVVRRHVGSGGG